MDNLGRVSQAEYHAALDRRDAREADLRLRISLLEHRLSRVEALACESLIDGENACMLRLIRIELGLSSDDPRIRRPDTNTGGDDRG